MRRREFGFNLQLLSDGEIPVKEVHVAALLKGHKFTISQVCYAIILIINNIGLVDSFSVFFCRKETGMQNNTWPLRNGCRMLCSPPFLGAEKGMTPTTICVTPRPLINNRSLNTPHQRHYSSYLLIFAFWGGVVKYREAPFSPNYVHVTTRCFLSAKVVEF